MGGILLRMMVVGETLVGGCFLQGYCWLGRRFNPAMHCSKSVRLQYKAFVSAKHLVEARGDSSTCKLLIREYPKDL